MREIKFRLFSQDTKKVIYSDDNGWFHKAFVGKNQVLQSIRIDVALNKTDRVTVMQYTGLKDKNGKEIYEGDVVDTIYDGELFTGIVVYDESELGFKATNGKENYGSNFQYLPCCEEVEIIGNIYEKPELLKTK